MVLRVLAILLAVALAAGCGGAGRLSAGQFRVKANRICSAQKRKTNAFNALNKQTLRRAIDAVQTEIAQLERLRPPASDVERYRALLASYRRTLELIRRDGPQLVVLAREVERAIPKRIGAFDKPPPHRYLVLSRRLREVTRPMNTAIRPANVQARALGLRECVVG